VNRLKIFAYVVMGVISGFIFIGFVIVYFKI